MWTVQDAKNKFSAVIDAALAGQPQQVSRRGKPAVVVVSAQDYHRLLAAAVAARESFVAHLLAFPTEGQDDIARADVRPRDVAF